VVERSERYASAAKPEEPRPLFWIKPVKSDERVTGLLGAV
jgi:hypothetical protein